MYTGRPHTRICITIGGDPIPRQKANELTLINSWREYPMDQQPWCLWPRRWTTN